MLLDIIVAFIIIKLFELEGLKILAGITLVALLRTCYLVISFIEAIVSGEDDYNVK